MSGYDERFGNQDQDKDNVVDVSFIPYGITHVIIDGKIKLNYDDLPSSMTHLKFIDNGYGYHNNNNNGKIPDNVEHLTFDDNFNMPLTDNLLPQNVKYINFGNMFNQKIDELPANLKELRLGNAFNSKIDFLPCGLTYLYIGDENVSVNTYSYSYDSFGYDYSMFNQEINNLPNSIKYICFAIASKFNKKIYNLPFNLETIIFGNNYSYLEELPINEKKSYKVIKYILEQENSFKRIERGICHVKDSQETDDVQEVNDTNDTNDTNDVINVDNDNVINVDDIIDIDD